MGARIFMKKRSGAGWQNQSGAPISNEVAN